MFVRNPLDLSLWNSWAWLRQFQESFVCVMSTSLQRLFIIPEGDRWSRAEGRMPHAPGSAPQGAEITNDSIRSELFLFFNLIYFFTWFREKPIMDQ